MTDDHPAVPTEEWDGRHCDWTEGTCQLCGGDLEHRGDSYEAITRCADSGETLFLR